MGNYTYILECADGTYYTGWTNNLKARLEAHNAGRGAKYTKVRRPVEMIYAECFDTKTEAMSREYAIKRLTRKQKEKLMAEGREEGKDVLRDGMQNEGSKDGQEDTMGKIYYLMGKSASGKNAVYEELLKREDLKLKPLVICTTRPIRSGETDGVDYYFMNEEQLEALQKAGKVIECRTYNTVLGPWNYFTVDNENLDLNKADYLGIGTLESYIKLKDYYGSEKVVPLYIEIDAGIRLERALKRERKQEKPQYEEMCRRFLADQADFSEEKLEEAGITRRYSNDGDRMECVQEIAKVIFG